MRIISPVRAVAQGVADLDRTVAFYERAFGFAVHGQGSFSASYPALAAAWQMPPGLHGEFAVVGPNDPIAPVLRLMAFDRPGERIWGNYESKQDLGPFAVNYRIPEIKAGWDRMIEAGATPRSKPMFWTILDGVSAWESQAIDPDGILMDVFELQGERTSEIFGPCEAPCSGVQTVALHSSDADRAKAFYMGLGYDEFYDRVFSGLEDLIHLPKGAKLRNVNLMMPDITPMGRIEIAQYIGHPGAPTRDKAVPPNLGVLAISFEVRDLNAACDAAINRGAVRCGGPAEIDFPPFGKVRLSTLFGPDGELLEFFARAA
jgi:catechol 2,3-dioxygenase-like lactoylglutathione lyase family enzyme